MGFDADKSTADRRARSVWTALVGSRPAARPGGRGGSFLRSRLPLAWLLASVFVASSVNAQVVRVSASGAFGVEPVVGDALPTAIAEPPVDEAVGARATDQPTTEPLGHYASLFDEQPGEALSLEAARERLMAGAFKRSTSAVPNLGNHAPARWMHLAIDNPGAHALAYRIYVAEGWTDQIDVWLLDATGPLQHWRAGDERSPSRYLRSGLGYGFDAALPPGRSELYVRVDSIDSAALALRLLPQHAVGSLEGSTQHWLGLVHGYLIALVATYGLLWLALRDANLLRYVAYVGSYLYMHLSYSGLAAHAVWPDSPRVAQYAILAGMVLFASAGLLFGRSFLGLATLAPRIDRGIVWTVRLALAGLTLCVLADAKVLAVDLAFAYIMAFTFAMVGLGVLGVRRRCEQAGIFMVATMFSMVGALVTTLAVMGRIPFSALTFRAVEVGVMVEASVWALALGLRLRQQQVDRARALELARNDPLTGLCNRRGFLDQALPIFSTSVRNQRPLAVLMIDIDRFKRINDDHGHDAGDRTLVAAAEQLQVACRLGDVVARWGGEEFVMLLPETDVDSAHALAERLRGIFAACPVRLNDGGDIAFTACFGVAVREEGMGLEDVIRSADAGLYAAKEAGRDRVMAAPAPGNGRATPVTAQA